MRLFIALKAPELIRKRLYDICAPFRECAETTVWSKPEQFHITLAFIGDAAPAFLPHLRQRLDRACAVVPAFDCHVAGYGFFGSRRSPTVLWAGIEPADALEALHKHFWKMLEPLGYEKPSPRFHPHITLARCKARARNKALLDAMDESETHTLGDWRSEGATLYESRRTSHGPLYRAIHTSPFAD